MHLSESCREPISTPVKRSRCSSPVAALEPWNRPSPRKQRLEVREQEKASIVNCCAIESSSGFRDLSVCDKIQFEECQNGHGDKEHQSSVALTHSRPVPSRSSPSKLLLVKATPLQGDMAEINSRVQVSPVSADETGNSSVDMIGVAPSPPKITGGVPRRPSDEARSSTGSLGSGVSFKEIKSFNAVGSMVKNPFRPSSSRGGYSSLSMRRPQSFSDMSTAKNYAELKHSRVKLDAYSTHIAALERVCREAGLAVPQLMLPLPPAISESSMAPGSSTASCRHRLSPPNLSPTNMGPSNLSSSNLAPSSGGAEPVHFAESNRPL